MEKIIMVSSDTEVNNKLLRCLELLFPECVIESLPKSKKSNGTDVFTHGRVKHRNTDVCENMDV
jgi:hypothetical protein